MIERSLQGGVENMLFSSLWQSRKSFHNGICWLDYGLAVAQQLRVRKQSETKWNLLRTNTYVSTSYTYSSLNYLTSVYVIVL